MFVIVELKDVVRTPPAVFNKKLDETTAGHLNSKLANKVITNVGLCIALFDILKMGDSFIFPGDGASHTKVEFRFIVFRPFIDEIIVGKIKSCSKDGVCVTLGFFDDIMIPSTSLQHPSRFDEMEQVWVWQFDNDGDTHDLFMDIGESIRFRVVTEVFVETSPVTCPEKMEVSTEPESKVPYSIIGSISEPGLGVLSWWEGT
ncbi:unnamed protein product [Bemisia tabaci]|uniref:DNA-directed RNA polymerase III subunit RPC8 n=1 Tax=Bemisia tabaci TaxID=7038 RepID=A0A9P0F0Y0_BEMTA|nr:PREDICTED: DNA-directed RNA polymerase III subunit RPC8 isoform X1 [Bemisia tabaci]CAH0385081.1 unnamed protein product [Bemisia tabaci]